jgi:beta-phosphoglucomutase-like phosphatase (HAD superfamily)
VIPCGAVLFDMDGLMVDSEPLWFEVERDFARARGGDWTPELAHGCIGRGLANTLRVMGETFSFPVDAQRDAAAIVDSFVERVGELVLKAGCEELVERAEAARLPRAVASSSARRLVEATLGRFGLVERFGALVTGDCVSRHKPAPDVFLAAASRLGVAPGACVVLEDSLAGVMAARAAGMRVIAVPEGAATEAMASLADAVVTDLHEASARLAF